MNMKIEAIKHHKNSADIKADGVEYKKLPLAEIVRFGMKAGAELDDAFFQEFLKACDKTAAKEYLLGLLSRGSKTEKEARNKLYQKGFRKESIKMAIEFAKQYKYIEDRQYANAYVQTNKQGKGTFRIKAELKQKGVSDEIIAEATEELQETEKESALAVGARYARGKDLNDRKVKEKLMRHLASRGFAYDVMREVLAKLGANTEDFEE